MEIELKRIGYDPRLDESAFVANLHVNGEKAAMVNSRAGNTQYYALDEKGADLVAQVEEYLKKQPGEKRMVDGKEQVVKQTLTGRIDALFGEYLAGIELKKFERKVQLMEKQNIVIGEPGRYMRTIPTKAQVSILVNGNNKDLIMELLTKKAIPSMTEGEKILNTNIPTGILKEAGANADQLIDNNKQELKPAQKKKTGIKP